MTLEYDEAKAGVLDEVKKTANKLEPDWEIIGL